jgi:hypothetical protein
MIILVKLKAGEVAPLTAICVIIVTFPHNPLVIMCHGNIVSHNQNGRSYNETVEILVERYMTTDSAYYEVLYWW